ncbi:serine/threonine-protein kinase [Nannocystis sp. SCPEA4]|uniref:protein kinase domain-containing protein n=1 Tax=Nannocystis sp. SCPEA4 TaxID=2996787 RepID=UPI00227172AB|nr:protein kinase [Nannocystis sp. SCPEA4]
MADRYTLIDELGKGAMGVVFTAFDRQLTRLVALKVMGPRTVGVGREKLFREARNLAQLNDPHVVQVYEVGEYRGEVYLAMEHVKGKSLAEWLRETKPSFSATLDVLLSAGRGISAAHAKRIVHRDIKPANILVGDDGRTRVADFGLAWSETDPPPQNLSDQTQPPVASRSTQRGAGTPAYMAPEQIRKEELDPRSDLFSFCIVAWEALYGAHPFPAGSSHDYAKTICDGQLRPPKYRPRQIPLQLERILRKGLLLSREDRYSNMGELLARLDKLRRRQTGRLILVVFGLIMIAGIATYAYIQRSEAHEQSVRAQTYADTAQKRLELAQELIGNLLDVVLPMSQSVPGAGEIQHVIGNHIELLDAGLGWDADDAAKIRFMRIMHIIRVAQFHEFHGELKEAIVRYEEGLTLARHLASSRPRNDSLSSILLLGVLMVLGNAQLDVGDFEAARINLGEANHIGRARQAFNPKAADALFYLAATYCSMGDLELDEGNRLAARGNFRKCEETIKQSVEVDPSGMLAQGLLLDASLRLGALDLAEGMPASARARFNQALERARFLVNRAPSDLVAQKTLADTLKSLGEIELQIGDIDTARKFLEEAMTIYSTLEGVSPDNADCKRGVADISENLGDLALKDGDLGEARAQFYRRLRYYEGLVATDPRNVGNQWALADSMSDLGELEMKAGDYAAARSFITKALEIQEGIVTMNPRAHRGELFVVQTLLRLGDLEMKVDNDAVAQIHFERGFRLAETVSRLDVQNNQARKALFRVHRMLGHLEQRRASMEAARVHFTRAREIAVFLAGIDREDIDAQYQVVEIQLRLAELAAARKDRSELSGLVDTIERLLTLLDKRGQASEFARRRYLRARLRELSQKLGEPPVTAKHKGRPSRVR